VQWGFTGFNLANVPTLPPGVGYVEVSAGYQHIAARRSDGRVVAWGRLAEGQCNIPAPPTGLGYVEVVAGGYHTLSRLPTDCNGNGIADGSDIAAGAADCNANSVVDLCELAAQSVGDCNLNNIPDSCEIALGLADCNLNHVPDACDLGNGTSADADLNQVPDECTQDCDANGLLDAAELSLGLAYDCDANQILDVCDVLAGEPDCNGDGRLDSCDFAAGAVDCNLNLVPDFCEVDANNDGLIDDCQDGGIAYCTGNGGPDATACPCGNEGEPGNGCPNSNSAAGARLEAVGLPSRIADSLVLRGSQMSPNSTDLYFQGTAQVIAPGAGTSGAVFGDGLRCAAGITVRLGVRQNENGASQLPSNGSTPLHTVGQIPASGTVTRYYQAWYRDTSPTFCTTNRYNLTNGVCVVWVP